MCSTQTGQPDFEPELPAGDDHAEGAAAGLGRVLGEAGHQQAAAEGNDNAVSIGTIDSALFLNNLSMHATDCVYCCMLLGFRIANFYILAASDRGQWTAVAGVGGAVCAGRELRLDGRARTVPEGLHDDPRSGGGRRQAQGTDFWMCSVAVFMLGSQWSVCKCLLSYGHRTESFTHFGHVTHSISHF